MCVAHWLFWDFGSGLYYSSVLTAFSVLPWFCPVHTYLRSESRVCVNSYTEIGDPLLQLILSHIPPIPIGPQIPPVLWPERWGFSRSFNFPYHLCNNSKPPEKREGKTKKQETTSYGLFLQVCVLSTVHLLLFTFQRPQLLFCIVSRDLEEGRERSTCYHGHTPCWPALAVYWGFLCVFLTLL